MNIKMIKSENNSGLISNGFWGANTLSFWVDLPKNAAVDYIRIKGEFDIEGVGKQKDKLLNDIECPVIVTYHREFAAKVHNPERMQRIIATAYFPEGIPVDLYNKINSGEIEHFDVYYHEEYVAVTE
ncbi:MAG: hypothetical protein IKU08_09225 [Clostridia bacterium]|nr:hypothetical protein [Clostridia bacterium]